MPGISLKTQELYALVFLTRYLDLFTRYFSFYNVLMKLFFIGSSIAIVWYMRYHKVVKQTHNKDQDTFRHYYLPLACFVVAILIPLDFTLIEVCVAKLLVVSYACFYLDLKILLRSLRLFYKVLWTFSIYLEAVAILPQLVLLQRSRNIDNLTGNYVFLLGYVISVMYFPMFILFA